MTNLSDVQRRMLRAGTFHIDGWSTERGQRAAADLAERGFVTARANEESQYTSINYTVTDSGRAALLGDAKP